MAIKVGRAKRMVAFLRKYQGEDRKKPEEAAEEGDLKAVEALAQQLDERPHDREQQATGHQQKGAAAGERRPPPAAAGEPHRRDNAVERVSPGRPNLASRASRC